MELCPHDNSAGDLVAGITGRLGCEVIGHCVDDNSASDDVSYVKAVGHDRHICTGTAPHQRWEVTGVLRMHHVVRIVVGTGFGEILTRTAFPLVDMKAVKAGVILRGQIQDVCCYKHAAASWHECDLSVKIGVVETAPYISDGGLTHGVSLHDLYRRPRLGEGFLF